MSMRQPISSEEIIAEFTEWTSSPRQNLIKWREKSRKKVIGCFPMDIPEEMIHAAGMLPVVIWENEEPLTLGQAHISPYNCGIIRSVIDDSARGKLDFLDGLVSYETCLQARHLPFIIQKTGWQGFQKRLFLPGGVVGQAGRRFMIHNLKRLKEGLERFSGREMSLENLSQSISLYNQNRRLLRELYQLRKRNPGLLKAREILAIVHSSMLMLKEEHSQRLGRLLEELEKREVKPEKRARVILSGSLCEAPRGLILDLIEEAGMVIMDDDLYVGSRYFLNDAREDEDPLEALTDRYMERVPPSPTKVDSEMDWGDYLLQMAAQNQALGVISLMVKYCPPHLAYYPDMERKLSRAGLHTLMLETEHEVTSLEQVKTRLQAFGESLEMA